MSYLFIEHQCPQCGAPAVLEETDRIFTCEYCKVKSYLLEKDYFRYVLPENAPEKDDLIFFPYWRFRGMLFSSLSDEILYRFVDVSQQAVESRLFPFSLGVRSLAMKLKFLSPETQGRFIRPSLPFKDVIRIFKERFKQSMPIAERSKLKDQAFTGETLSLIYAPFYIADYTDSELNTSKELFDGVLNKPLSHDGKSNLLNDELDRSHFPEERPDWRIGFVPAICPGCGWDLSGERDTLVLECKNCNSVWHPGRNGLKKFNYARLSGDGAFYFPFWRIKADISGIILQSYSDLIRLANIPKAVQKGWDDIEFFFWVPAFKVSPRNFLMMGSNMTIAQPSVVGSSLSVGSSLRLEPTAGICPVRLTVINAVESLKTCLANIIRPKKMIMPRLSQIVIKPKNFLLVYVPFSETHHEYINEEYHLTVHKNTLKRADNM